MYGWIKIGVKMGQTDRASSLVLFFFVCFWRLFYSILFYTSQYNTDKNWMDQTINGSKIVNFSADLELLFTVGYFKYDPLLSLVKGALYELNVMLVTILRFCWHNYYVGY